MGKGLDGGGRELAPSSSSSDELSRIPASPANPAEISSPRVGILCFKLSRRRNKDLHDGPQADPKSTLADIIDSTLHICASAMYVLYVVIEVLLGTPRRQRDSDQSGVSLEHGTGAPWRVAVCSAHTRMVKPARHTVSPWRIIFLQITSCAHTAPFAYRHSRQGLPLERIITHRFGHSSHKPRELLWPAAV